MKYLLIVMAISCFCAGLLCLPQETSAAGVSKIIVIIHADQKTSKDFEKKPDVLKLQKIFLKQTLKWQDGKSFYVVQQTGNTEAEIFRTKVLKKTEDQLEKHWSDKDSEDGTKPPKSYKTNKDIFKKVSKRKNAIGYVSASYYNDTLTDEERKKLHKVLTIAK